MEIGSKIWHYAKAIPAAVWIYTAATAAIVLPMLLPGYILTLDMAFTPHLPMPDSPTASYPFHALLYIANTVVPSQILQKLMLAAILFGSGYGAYALIRYTQLRTAVQYTYANLGAYVGGLLYMVNPYTYSRFMAGQYAVLLGYACLPFFTRALLKYLEQPTIRTTAILGAWAFGVCIVSMHTIGLALVIATIGISLAVWRQRTDTRYLKKLLGFGCGLAGALLVANSYWLLPLIGGDNSTAQALSGFSEADRTAFATLGDTWAAKVLNVSVLQGFWAEARDLYLLPQALVPLWSLVTLGLWIIVGLGARALWRMRQRRVLIVLGVSGILAVVLASTNLLDWLSTVLPVFAGYREPHKFIGLLALTYSVLAAWGVAWALDRYHARNQQKRLAITMVGVLLLPIVLTPTMFWGFASQLTPRQYPNDWAVMRTYLEQNSGKDDHVLFLPWHLYMHFSFADRIIVNPAESYYSVPVIASNELEFRGASPTFPDAQKARLSSIILPGAPTDPQLGQHLARERITYVLLAKEYDYRRYDYLDRQPNIRLVKETANLKLYRNTAKE